MTMFQWFLTVLFIGVFENIVISYNPLLTYIIRFKHMSFSKNITGNYTINEFNGQQYLNGYINIYNNDIDTDVVHFERCDQDALNCEYFQSWKLTDLCTKLNQKNQIWSNIYDTFEPPMRCPFNKTHYFMRNATVDVDRIIRWYPDATNYRWKITQKYYAGEVYVGSCTFDVYLFGYRKKNRNPNH